MFWYVHVRYVHDAVCLCLLCLCLLCLCFVIYTFHYDLVCYVYVLLCLYLVCLCSAMLCFAMFMDCYVLLCYVMSCYVYVLLYLCFVCFVFKGLQTVISRLSNFDGVRNKELAICQHSRKGNRAAPPGRSPLYIQGGWGIYVSVLLCSCFVCLRLLPL